MPTHEEHILHILGEAGEPLFASETADRLNHELGPGPAYTNTEVVGLLKSLSDQVTQLPDGRWALKGWISEAMDRRSIENPARNWRARPYGVSSQPKKLTQERGFLEQPQTLQQSGLQQRFREGFAEQERFRKLMFLDRLTRKEEEKQQ